MTNEQNPVAMILYAAQNYPENLEILPWIVIDKPKRSVKSSKASNGPMVDYVKPAKVMLAIPDEWAKKLLNAPEEHSYMMIRIDSQTNKRQESAIILPGEVS